MLDPSQFEPDQAWIVFQLNEKPILTKRDGAFDCIVVMDAASGFIYCSTLFGVDEGQPSQFVSRRALKDAFERCGRWPREVIVASELRADIFCQEIPRKDIKVSRHSEEALWPFIGEAKSGFRERVERG